MHSSHIAGAIGVALAIALTCGQASAATRFGSKLEANTQPSNAGKGHECVNKVDPCTWIMMEAYGRPGSGHKAPKDGLIGAIRLIGCAPGEFQLQIARAKPASEEGRVVRDGPVIQFQGDPKKCRGQKFEIETFNLNDPVPVKKGDYLAMKTPITSTLRCSSGGANILQFRPPLIAGESPRPATDTDGCWLLLEAEYID